MSLHHLVSSLPHVGHLGRAFGHVASDAGARSGAVRWSASWGLLVSGLLLSIGLALAGRMRLARLEFRRLTILKKLALGFGTLIALSLVSGVFIFKQARDLTHIQEMNVASDRLVDHLDLIRFDAAMSWGAGRDYAAGGLPADRRLALHYIARRRSDAATARTLILRRAPQLLGRFDEFVDASRAYDSYFSRTYLKDAPDGSASMSRQALTDPRERLLRTRSSAAYWSLRRAADRWSASWDAQSANAITQSRRLAVLAALLTALLGATFATVFARAISRPLQAMARRCRRSPPGTGASSCRRRIMTTRSGRWRGRSGSSATPRSPRTRWSSGRRRSPGRSSASARRTRRNGSPGPASRPRCSRAWRRG